MDADDDSGGDGDDDNMWRRRRVAAAAVDSGGGQQHRQSAGVAADGGGSRRWWRSTGAASTGTDERGGRIIILSAVWGRGEQCSTYSYVASGTDKNKWGSPTPGGRFLPKRKKSIDLETVVKHIMVKIISLSGNFHYLLMGRMPQLWPPFTSSRTSTLLAS